MKELNYWFVFCSISFIIIILVICTLSLCLYGRFCIWYILNSRIIYETLYKLDQRIILIDINNKSFHIINNIVTLLKL